MSSSLSEVESSTLIRIAGGSASSDHLTERDVEEPAIDDEVLKSLERKGLVRVERTESGSVRSIVPAGYAMAILEAHASTFRSGVPMGDWRGDGEE